MQTSPTTIMAMCRPQTRTIFDGDGRPQQDVLASNIALYCETIAQAAGDHGARLIGFPQFALTGYTPLGGDGWLEASVRLPGPEIDRMAEAARQANAYVMVQLSERHDAFPGRYFLSAVLLTPEGGIGIVHRKSYAMSLRTSPGDVYDKFVETFGPDAFFPVLETPLGRIGMLIGGEVNWPEPVRALALKGAEIIVNPVAAAPHIDYMKRPGAEMVRNVRAFENMLYLGMANIALEGAPPSRIFDFNGGDIGGDAGDDGLFTLAAIGMDALRKARSAPSANFLAQIQPSIHAPLTQLPLWPRSAFPDRSPAGADELIAVEAASWQRLQAHIAGQGKG